MSFTSESKGIVVQHNAFINARFTLSTTELKLFLCMLRQIKKETKTFEVMEIPVTDVLRHLDLSCGSVYQRVKKAAGGMTKKSVEIEDAETGEWISYSMMDFCSYKKGEGFVKAKFNNSLDKFLLGLNSTFTTADYAQLQKLNTFESYRLYWLLKQVQRIGGKRVLGFHELKTMLCMEEKYPLFANFKQRVLVPAQAELDQTDIPFAFKGLLNGRAVDRVEFSIVSKALTVEVPSAAEPNEWEVKLSQAGVSKPSISEISLMVERGDIPAAYIGYCIGYYRKVEREHGIKRTFEDAVYTAIVTKQLLERYHKAVAAKVAKPAAKSGQPAAPAPKISADDSVLVLWQEIMAKVMLEVPPMDLTAWFRPVSPVSCLNNELVLRVPSEQFISGFEDRFIGVLSPIIRDLNPSLRVSYEVVVAENVR